MASQSTRTLLLAAGVVGAGLLAWGLAGDPAGDRSAPEASGEAPEVLPRGARNRETPPDFGGPPGSTPRRGAQDGVPRILPPDAALEDIRDALALEGTSGGTALQAAFRETSRLATRSMRVLVALQRRIEDEEDARVRGIATAALGSSPSAENRKWLRAVLRDATQDEDRLGALIALARPARAGAPEAASATATLLRSLEYTYAPLPEGTKLLASMARFLDAADGTRVRDALPIVTASVKASAVYATLLAADGKEACRWYQTLAGEDRAALRAHALRHTSLLPEVRRVLEAK